MKKYIAIMISLVIVVSAFSLSSCTDKSGDKTDPTEAPSYEDTSDLDHINEMTESLTVPKITEGNIYLPTSIGDVACSWESSDPALLNSSGVLLGNQHKNVTLKATLTYGDALVIKEFNTMTNKLDHLYIDKSFADGELNNVVMTSEGLKLVDGATEGYFLSKEIDTKQFLSMVGSFSGYSAIDATIELTVSIKVDGNYSKFFSYGAWGLGLKNKYYDQNDTDARLVDDEIMTKNSKFATGFKVKVILRRDSADVSSPALRLFALAIQYSDSYNNTYVADTKDLPKEVLYEVPTLCQLNVPTIGGSICSPSTSAMLLAYRGISTAYDKAKNYPAYSGYSAATLSYDNGNFAALCEDNGHTIWGNWSYNAICMGAFGATAYVQRFTSFDEVKWHLANIGPVSASIRGHFISNNRDYVSQGHLIVVTGYKVNDDGSTIVYINDPAVTMVKSEMTLENFLNIYRYVSYVIE